MSASARVNHRGTAAFSWSRPKEHTHVLLSTQPIVSLLRPSVFAVSSNRLFVPLSIPLCSTRFSSTARPCEMYWSIEFSLSCRNVCSRRAKSSRAVGPLYVDWFGANGDSCIGDAGAFRRVAVDVEEYGWAADDDEDKSSFRVCLSGMTRRLGRETTYPLLAVLLRLFEAEFQLAVFALELGYSSVRQLCALPRKTKLTSVLSLEPP